MRKFIWASAALFAVALMAGCQPNAGTTPEETTTGTTTGTATNGGDKPAPTTDSHAADSSGVKYAANFDEAISAAEKDNKLVLIKFTADWCGPCHQMSDEMKETDLSKQFAKVIPVEVDIDKENTGAAVKNHLVPPNRPIPYLVLIDKTGKEIATFTGRMPMDEFKTWLDTNTKA